MRVITTRVHARLSAEHGFTMVTVMVAMLAVMLISVAAIAAASGDIRLSRYDQDDKQAYAAAEAGVNDYLGQLNADPNYWANCTDVPAPGAVNQQGVSATDRKWRSVPGATSSYSIELIPNAADGYKSCDKNNPINSMVTDGNIKIRVTGRSSDATSKNYRTINATFRRAGFLDFLYYTNLENQDPAYIQRTLYPLYPSKSTSATDNPNRQDLVTWAGDRCERYWRGSKDTPGQGRGQAPAWTGQFEVYPNYFYPSSPTSITTMDPKKFDDLDQVQPAICGEITFVTGDEVNGPFHSNDDILISGSPAFGRAGGSDRVEVSGNGWRGSGSPQFRTPGGLKTKAAQLDPPSTNGSLKDLTLPGYSFTGQTTITLAGDQMTVKNANLNNNSPTTMPFPDNGVVYVDNGTCGAGYNPIDWKAQNAGCGDVRLQGTYSKDLTIGARNDIVVTDTTKRVSDSDDSLLGLIADGFVRVWHPVDKEKSQYDDCNNVGSPTNVRIDAAILTLHGSFTVDNYWCGAALGNLTVNGAIAQNHRGVVGSTNNGSHGYIKKYTYNEDLKYRSPPHFLDPIQSSWRILRQGEQSPPCVKTATACPAP